MVGDEAGSGQARVILVAGGTGRLGTLVVRELSRRGEQVRVLTRNPDRAAHLQSSSVDIVTGDVRHPASLSPAVAGVRVVVSAVQGFAGPGRGSPDSVDRKGNANLVAAAAAEGADVVLLSMVGAAPDSRLVMARAKFDAEESLKASGVPWTIVRSTPFLETWAAFLAV
ncbi:MAG TPA: NAD(P)H-binding protein, partial [Actinomycetota bacterium]|nr:NAD(P)H-binding protein [Actinomycetota bacterium]